MANVQISEELLLALFKFHCLDLPEDDRELLQREIRKGLNAKMNAIISRQIYSDSKNPAATPEQRERARQEYLERKGIPVAWRW